jgi:hypothetical protein
MTDEQKQPEQRPAATAERDTQDPFAGVPQQTGMQSLMKRDASMAAAFTGLVPSSIGEALSVAQTLARSKAVPKSLQGEPESVFTIILAGVELGLTPLRAIQSISIISGSLAMKADLQLALVRRSASLAFFDEGFERAGKTDGDGNLEDRLRRRGRTPAEQNELAEFATTILDLTDDVPEGQPYGWAIAQRIGDPQKHLRVFSCLDAERFKYTEWDGPDNNRRKVEKTLAEKAAYVNNPQDMYPKRARVRVLQVTHSDVLAGMPAVEALDEAVIDGEVVRTEAMPQAVSSEDVIDQMLGAIDQADKTLGTSIRAGFDTLQMGIAKRLQLLRKFDGNPTGLAEALKDEYALQKSGGRFGRKTAAPAVPAEQAKAAADSGTAAASGGTTADSPKTTDQEPAKAEQPANPVKSVAERFRKLRTI